MKTTEVVIGDKKEKPSSSFFRGLSLSMGVSVLSARLKLYQLLTLDYGHDVQPSFQSSIVTFPQGCDDRVNLFFRGICHRMGTMPKRNHFPMLTRFLPGQTYTLPAVKNGLQEIYDILGLNIKATATQLQKYLPVEIVQPKLQDGSRPRMLRIKNRYILIPTAIISNFAAMRTKPF